VEIGAGPGHTCVRLDTGAVRCWGDGSDGALGYGSAGFIFDASAVGDVPLGGKAVQLAVGGHHTCARLETGAVRCWGLNGAGQLGYGNLDSVGDDETPESVGDVPLGGTAVELAAGENHTCARLDTGAIRCWGNGLDGRLGHGNTESIGDDEPVSAGGDVPFE
jgi:hypothetical protein